MQQARLADAGLPGEDQQLRSPALGCGPDLERPRTLPDPAHEGACLSGALRRPLPARSHELLVDAARLRRGLRAQPPLQNLAACVVCTQCARPLSPAVEEPHQQPVGLLAQRVGRDEPLGPADRLARIPAIGEHRGEAAQRVEVPLSQSFALLQDPLVVVALEQVAAIDLDGVPQRLFARTFQRSLEDGHIDSDGQIGPPAQGPRRDLEEAIGLRQRPPERMQEMPQVRARLRLAGLRPQQGRQPLARLGRVAMEKKVGKQGLRSSRLQRRQPTVAQPELELAEQLYGQGLGRQLVHRQAQSPTARRPPSTWPR